MSPRTALTLALAPAAAPLALLATGLVVVLLGAFLAGFLVLSAFCRPPGR